MYHYYKYYNTVTGDHLYDYQNCSSVAVVVVLQWPENLFMQTHVFTKMKMRYTVEAQFFLI